MNRKRIFIPVILIFSIACILMSDFRMISAAPALQTEGETEAVPADDAEITLQNEETPVPDEEEKPLPEPPEAPVGENPQGNFASRAMGFYWEPSQNADYYEVSWKNDQGYSETLQLKNDDWTCRMNRCIVYTELPSDGNYTWTVSAVNEGGSTASEELQFTIPALVPTPDAYRPDAAHPSHKPLIFEWEDAGSNVSAYRIQAAETDNYQICLDLWYDENSINHVNGVCYLETDIYLPSGSYVWRVQGSNSTSVSNWSSWVPFTVTCAECDLGTYLNTATAAVYPIGISTDTAARFVWKTVTGAQSYQLEVKDAQEVILLDENVSAANCRLELCTYSPDLTFTDGERYTWSISTYGWNNSFWGSANGAFVCRIPAGEIDDISFISAEDNMALDPDNAQIIWTDPGAEAVSFRIGIRSSEGEWSFISDLSREDAWCDGITCSIQFYTIPDDSDYEIVVIPYSEFNVPGNAAVLSFSSRGGDEKGSVG